LQGYHEIADYVFDYGELPEDGIDGMFDADAYILRAGSAVACIKLTVEFSKLDNDED
jgi:hypothetical protein